MLFSRYIYLFTHTFCTDKKFYICNLLSKNMFLIYKINFV
nr:MAG TPA: hypothetical protein [Caudoviricetes sp.]